MRLDPRTKLLILAVTSVSVFMNKSIAVECVLAGIPLVLLSVSGNLKRTLKYAAFFLALLLIQLFIVPRLPVTFGGIVYMFAVYIRKLLPCFMLGSFLIATTSVSKFLAAITKLRLSKGLTIALAIIARFRCCTSAFSILQSKAKSSIPAPVKLFLPKEESRRMNERHLQTNRLTNFSLPSRGFLRMCL